jgi:Tol biopolymer transport system component
MLIFALAGLSWAGGPFDPSMCDTTADPNDGCPPALDPPPDYSEDVQAVNGPSSEPSISADGRYVAFRSSATNIAFDTNHVDDVFVYDRTTFESSRVSVSSIGLEATGASGDPAITADGRYVAFRSSASNLVAGDTNAADDVFLHDRLARTTERVSVSASGTQATGPSTEPAISGDGRYVAFRSSAANLVSGDTNEADDVFLRDRTSGTTTRVSVGPSAVQANAGSTAPAVSANGGVVAFESTASNLVAGDTNSASDVFIRNVPAASTTRVSLSSGGAQGSGASSGPSISFDGARIAFQSTAAFASGDSNAGSDIYVRDRSANTTFWATKWAADSGWTTGGTSSSPAISGDARYVALVLHSDVHVRDVNRARDIYEYDLLNDLWAFVSSDDVNGPGNKASDSPTLSADATYSGF